MIAIIPFLCLLLYFTWEAQANLLNDAIRDVFAKTIPLPKRSQGKVSETSSYIEELCSTLIEPADRQRVACCSSVNGGILYLNNVQFRSNRIVFYSGGSGAYTLDGSPRLPPATLPVINSVVRRKVKEFTMATETKSQRFAVSNCTSYFNGTLHVFGRQTTQNLYHALNDNILPLLTHIVFDAHLRPELLTAPRAMLTGFLPPPDKEQVPHLDAILRAVLPKQFALGSATEGVCFRRVAWGGGVKVMYQHLLGAVRREAADLLRQVVLQGFHPPNPYDYRSTPQMESKGSNEGKIVDSSIAYNQSEAVLSTRALRSQHRQLQDRSQPRPKASTQNTHTRPAGTGGNVTPAGGGGFIASVGKALSAAVWPTGPPPHSAPLTVPSKVSGHRRPLNVVIYTRGSSGVGRTIAGEDALRDRLDGLGAHALVCCDFSAVTLAQQLGYAVHADVVMGLHGAGLVNSILAPAGVITLELKTIYGYGLTLFALAAEARQGIFIELDIRDYHIWGKPGQSRNHPVDDALIGRVVQALEVALHHRPPAGGDNSSSPHQKATICPLRDSSNFKESLFLPLARRDARRNPAIAGGKALSGGDLMVLPYPIAAWAQEGGARVRHLDFQLDILGPEIAEAPAQCEAMALSAYWAYVGERGVKEKHCLTC